MVVLLLMFKIRMNSIPFAGVGGLCVGIFSSLQGWLCVGVLCALQCAKNSVGSCWQSHGCLYVCRMFNRDVQRAGLAAVLEFMFVQPGTEAQQN